MHPYRAEAPLRVITSRGLSMAQNKKHIKKLRGEDFARVSKSNNKKIINLVDADELMVSVGIFTIS